MNFIKQHKIISLIAVLAILYNIVWIINYYQFNPLEGNYTKKNGVYYNEEQQYTTTYKVPQYPSMEGNYAIINEDDSIRIIVWTKNIFNRQSRYALYLYDSNNNHDYVVYVDKDMNYMEEGTSLSKQEIKEVQVLLNQRKQQINHLLKTLESKYKK